ncbi:MAG: hypothetical protein OXC69_03250 [Candidatus Tectomicrobia bacterium]|nr:hypothetical protein [Candidatus Tectomicrobia bacterium]
MMVVMAPEVVVVVAVSAIRSAVEQLAVQAVLAVLEQTGRVAQEGRALSGVVVAAVAAKPVPMGWIPSFTGAPQ